MKFFNDSVFLVGVFDQIESWMRLISREYRKV